VTAVATTFRAIADRVALPRVADARVALPRVAVGPMALPGVAALVVTRAALDTIAAGILLLHTPLSPSLEIVAAAVAHGMAVLLMTGLVQTRPSRRWLGGAAVLAVPCVGAAVAAAIFLTRGRGSAVTGRRRKARRRPALTVAAIQRLGGALSICDALHSGDQEQRRVALSALSRRSDPEAIASLRRAAAGVDPDLALSAALVLDEIAERAERELDLLDPVEVRDGTG